jgi:hypothetical protein
MNGNIVWEDEPIRKVESDFDESNFLEDAVSIEKLEHLAWYERKKIIVNKVKHRQLIRVR